MMGMGSPMTNTPNTAHIVPTTFPPPGIMENHGFILKRYELGSGVDHSLADSGDIKPVTTNYPGAETDRIIFQPAQ